MEKAIFNWSGGKDSSLALYHVLKSKKFDIRNLVTTLNSQYQRISMHGVRRELLLAQEIAIGIPIHEVFLPEMPSMDDYDKQMHKMLSAFKKQGVSTSIFGDIFLEDLKKYREEKLQSAGFKGYFPLWKRDTTELIHEFLDLGFKTIVTCAKAEHLSADFVGQTIDKDFLKELPKNVDPCGENGEFHTYVYEAPFFKQDIPIEIGEKVYREYEAPKSKEDACFSNQPVPKDMGFHYCDVKLKSK